MCIWVRSVLIDCILSVLLKSTFLSTTVVLQTDIHSRCQVHASREVQCRDNDLLPLNFVLNKVFIFLT